ncbi:hypothetical protein LINGRAHAP2_LOCUS37075 [Linum grandiflorum]
MMKRTDLRRLLGAKGLRFRRG